MSIRFNIDGYHFLTNKWTWFSIGIFLLIISAIIRVDPTNPNPQNDYASLIDSLTYMFGILCVLIWLVWWVFENFAFRKYRV